MEAFDNICFFIGIISVVIGIYEFLTKKLVGRDTANIPEEQCLRFLPYDALTYILTGILMAVLGQSSRIPFLQKPFAVPALVILAIAIIGLNIYYANRILGRRR